MDNSNSRPSLDLPTVPSDFESRAGSSRVDFAKALFELLKGATITNIVNDEPNPFDLGSVQAALTALTAEFNQNGTPKQRLITVQAVTNGLITIAFDDIGTTSYKVSAIFLTNGADINTVTWSLVDGSKATNQCQIWVDGTAAAYKLEVHILQVNNT